MVAVGADLVSAEGGLATMALPVHAHHNTLLDPVRLGTAAGRTCDSPFCRFEAHAVFGEEGTRLFLADFHVGSGIVDRALGYGGGPGRDRLTWNRNSPRFSRRLNWFIW